MKTLAVALLSCWIAFAGSARADSLTDLDLMIAAIPTTGPGPVKVKLEEPQVLPDRLLPVTTLEESDESEARSGLSPLVFGAGVVAGLGLGVGIGVYVLTSAISSAVSAQPITLRGF